MIKRLFGAMMAAMLCAVLFTVVRPVPVVASPATMDDCNSLFASWNDAIDNFESKFNLSQTFQGMADGVTGHDQESNYARESYQQRANTYGYLADAWMDTALGLEDTMKQARCI